MLRYVFSLGLFYSLFMITAQTKDYTQYVNPLIGTSKMGHVFPGATSPFGAVQLSPQTNYVPMFDDEGKYNPKTYEYCAGYQYKDSVIIGFSHTNFSGTGHSDLGDILIMPTIGDLQLNPSPNLPQDGYASRFSHRQETAQAGYYSVQLLDYDIQAELTTSDRVGMSRFHFPTSDEAHLILDLVYNVYGYDGKNVYTFIRVENDSLITGYRQTHGWARTRTVYFAMEFSQPFKSYGFRREEKVPYDGFYRKFNQTENFPEIAGKKIKAYFNFSTQKDKPLLVKTALSSVSTDGAIKNLKSEIPHWDFNQVKAENKAKWNKELSKIEINPLKPEDNITFYTALYHSFLSPILYEDVDGQYRGLDQNIHQSNGFTNYTIFSLWDTYRALHPLFNLLQPKRNNDMIHSMLAHQQQSVHGMLPIWSHYANENWCMIGYHSVSVIADAMIKNVGDFDSEKAIEAAIHTSQVPYYDGLMDYMNVGYVPEDKSHSSVSKTLEYAYDDWCIEQIANKTGDHKTENIYAQRAQNFRNVYDAQSGFMRPKLSDGSFKKEFDPMDTHGQGFIEGNAWNYGLYVPHAIPEMIEMMGGKKRMENYLDSLFTVPIADKYIEKNEDITRDGIIGNYVHGNEPSHHVAYLFNYCDAPEKTQFWVREILNTMYGPTVEGLCGNDDAGQMSAWYIFSSLGFYPVCPGSEWYNLGSPNVKNAKVNLPNGKSLEIIASNADAQNVYVKKVSFNDKEITDYRISHFELMKGGKLIFEMSPTP